MKKFWEKSKNTILVVLGIIVFVGGSILLQKASEKPCVISDEINSWIEITSKDEYVVTVLAQTTCGHCINFKPIFTTVAEENNLNTFWFEVNTMEKCDYEALTKTHNLQNYGGTPHTFITKAGKLVAEFSGAADQEELEEFLRENKVIK